MKQPCKLHLHTYRLITAEIKEKSNSVQSEEELKNKSRKDAQIGRKTDR